MILGVFPENLFNPGKDVNVSDVRSKVSWPSKTAYKAFKSKRGFSYHAEIVAYYRTPKRFRPHITLLVIRINAEGELCMSKPCENCQRILGDKKIKVVHS
jgi:hypothetical protein